jgi:hypothetical protein
MRVVVVSAEAVALAEDAGEVATPDAVVPTVEGLWPAPRKSAVNALHPDRMVPNTAMVRILMNVPLAIVAGC